MNLVLARTDTERGLSDVFTLARDRLPGTGRVFDVRRQAFGAYERAGLPHRRIEEWKYTDLRALMREVLPLADAPNAEAVARARAALASVKIEDATRLVLVDGVFVPNLSDVATLPAGVSVRTLCEVLESAANEARADLLLSNISDAMLSLNAAMATDGVVVGIGDGVALENPVQIIHVATAASRSTFTRSHVRIGNGARAKLVESFVAADGAQAYQAHDAVVTSVGDGAELTHVRLMADAPDAFNITSAIVTVGARSRVGLFNMTSGGAVSRFQGFIEFSGEGSELSVNGVNLLKGKQHGDTTLVVDHAVPHCTSRENFRAVIDDRGHSVFQGRIIVRPDAQKTDSKQTNKNLVLSSDAVINTKPELQIHADDVRCTHGATIGQLDAEAMFYLQSRGIGKREARSLLTYAFAQDIVDRIKIPALRESLERMLFEKFHEHGH
jgi:Fe-S cluster assembly protein SufD